MRTVLLIACLMLSRGSATHAQQPAPAIAVTIDVTVLDRSGRAVTGLAAADFNAELDGRAQPVLAVTYLPAGAPMAGGVGPLFDAVTPATPVYRIVVQPPADSRAGQEFSAVIKVARPDTKIQADPRAVAAPLAGRAPATPSASVPAATSTEERLRNAIATGRPSRALAIALATRVRRGSDPAQVSLDVQIELPATAKGPLTTLLGVVDARGAIRTANRSIAPAQDGTNRFDFSLPLEPGPYKVRFAAADAAGTIGSIESPVKAELVAMGPLLASSLLRWVPDSTGGQRPLILDALPSDAAAVGATLELYATAAAAPPPDLLVKLTLGPDDSAQPAWIERIVTPEVRDGVLIAEAEFPLARVPSGTHALRAVVLSGTTVLGTTSATVIKR